MTEVLAFLSFGESLLVALALAVYAAVNGFYLFDYLNVIVSAAGPIAW